MSTGVICAVVLAIGAVTQVVLAGLDLAAHRAEQAGREPRADLSRHPARRAMLDLASWILILGSTLVAAFSEV